MFCILFWIKILKGTGHIKAITMKDPDGGIGARAPPPPRRPLKILVNAYPAQGGDGLC